MKPIYLYAMTENYTKMIVWTGSKMTRSRICETTIKPKPGLSRRERHRVLSEELYQRFGIPGPVYRSAKRKENAEPSHGPSSGS